MIGKEVNLFSPHFLGIVRSCETICISWPSSRFPFHYPTFRFQFQSKRKLFIDFQSPGPEQTLCFLLRRQRSPSRKKRHLNSSGAERQRHDVERFHSQKKSRKKNSKRNERCNLFQHLFSFRYSG